MHIARCRKRALWLHKCEAYLDALKEWHSIKDTNPCEPLVDYIVGVNNLLLHDLDGALKAFDTADKRGRDLVDSRNKETDGFDGKLHCFCALDARSRCFDIMGEADAAQADREEVDRLGGNSVHALLSRAVINVELNFIPIGEALYKTCLQKDPQNHQALLGLASLEASLVVCLPHFSQLTYNYTLLTKTECNIRQNKATEAIALSDNLLRLQGIDSTLRCTALQYKAMGLIMLRSFGDAHEVIKDALDANVQKDATLRSLWIKGNLEFLAGDPAFLESFQKVVDEDSEVKFRCTPSRALIKRCRDGEAFAPALVTDNILDQVVEIYSHILRVYGPMPRAIFFRANALKCKV